MAWRFDGSGTKGSGVRRDWIEEGNVPVYMFQSEPDRVRFLLEEPNVEEVAEKRNMTMEEAAEMVFTEGIWDRWIQPVPQWEHIIPAIPGKRFFSTQACIGMRTCPLCAENQEAKDNGITENKMLPYPVRKRFIAPAWVPRLKKVLYVKQSQEFWEEVGMYTDQNGLDIEFDIYKTGKGFSTKYKAIYIGKSKAKAKVPDLGPKELDFIPKKEDVDRKLGSMPEFPPKEESEEEESKEEKWENPFETGDPGGFVIPFGSHKGKSIQELFDSGEVQYLQFLESRSSGLVQEQVSAFLKEQTE